MITKPFIILFSKYVKEEDCVYDGTCSWNNGTCVSNNIADRPCDEDEIKTVLRFFGYLLLIARVAVPLIIIGFATFDLFKSVVDKDEKSFPWLFLLVSAYSFLWRTGGEYAGEGEKTQGTPCHNTNLALK